MSRGALSRARKQTHTSSFFIAAPVIFTAALLLLPAGVLGSLAALLVSSSLAPAVPRIRSAIDARYNLLCAQGRWILWVHRTHRC